MISLEKIPNFRMARLRLNKSYLQKLYLEKKYFLYLTNIEEQITENHDTSVMTLKE